MASTSETYIWRVCRIDKQHDSLFLEAERISWKHVWVSTQYISNTDIGYVMVGNPKQPAEAANASLTINIIDKYIYIYMFIYLFICIIHTMSPLTVAGPTSRSIRSSGMSCLIRMDLTSSYT